MSFVHPDVLSVPWVVGIMPVKGLALLECSPGVGKNVHSFGRSSKVSSVDHFIPDVHTDTSSPIIAAYIDAYTEGDDLIVDPFCQSAAIVREALKAGRRVVAVSFNPLDALRTRLSVVPVPEYDLRVAVTRLGDSPKHDTTLREHLRRLYCTSCRCCEKQTIADYFVWERDGERPQQVHCHCPSCGEAGLRDCDESDAVVLSEVQPRGLHYWYVLDRVARAEDRGRKLAAQLLDLYTPRNLYVLFNLLLKLEDLFSGSAVHDFLRLVLLQCLELGSKLNIAPDEPPLPPRASLRPPSRFIEWNVWQLFESAARQLAQRPSVSPVALGANVTDINLLPSVAESERTKGSVRAFVGQVSTRTLVSELPAGSICLIWTRPPALGRGHWVLPYLWTGWLYGHQQAALLWPLVRQRSPDWPWYLQAMRSILLAMRKLLNADGSIVFVAQHRPLAYHEAVSLAAEGAMLRLRSALYHSAEQVAADPYAGGSGDYRSIWTPGAPAPPWPMSTDELAARIQRVGVDAAKEALRQRAEPTPFSHLHCHIWKALAQQGLLQRVMSADEQLVPMGFVRENIQAALEGEKDHTFVQLWESEEEQTCWWWLVEPPEVTPLAERVEQFVCEILESAGAISSEEFVRHVYEHFPSVLTPDTAWLMACLGSYGREVEAARWTLRDEDLRVQRTRAREMSLRYLQDLGLRLGYEVRLDVLGFDVQWVSTDRDVLAFVVLDSAALSRLLRLPLGGAALPERRIVIVAEARQELIRLRLSRSVWLRKPLAEQGWQFIRDTDLLSWVNQEEIALADLDSFVGLDLLAAQDRTQLPLI